MERSREPEDQERFQCRYTALSIQQANGNKHQAGLDFRSDSTQSPPMPARIYQRPKNAMQSGKARIEEWLLEFVPAEAKRPDPVMGWQALAIRRARLRSNSPMKPRLWPMPKNTVLQLSCTPRRRAA